MVIQDLKGKLEKFVNSPRHKDMSSAVFLLMGHGSKTGIQCTDEEVTTEFISDMVSRMEHMNGKPKMIFFQCCRGSRSLYLYLYVDYNTSSLSPSHFQLLPIFIELCYMVIVRHFVSINFTRSFTTKHSMFAAFLTTPLFLLSFSFWALFDIPSNFHVAVIARVSKPLFHIKSPMNLIFRIRTSQIISV